LGKAYTYLRHMQSLLVLLCVLGGTHAYYNLTLDACPKAPYWPVNKTFTYGPSREPVQLCVDASQMPESYNGFLLTFADVKVAAPDSLCAVLSILPFSGGSISYVTVSCAIRGDSIVAYGGVCNARALGDAYWLAFGSESALITPTPLPTTLSFSMSIQWTKTQIC